MSQHGHLVLGRFADAGCSARAPSFRRSVPYCTPDDVITSLGAPRVAELTGDRNGGTVDQGRLERAVVAATARIRTAVLMHHTTDLDGRSEYLAELAVAGAELMLQARSAGGLGGKESSARLDMEQWVTDVKAIASGDVALEDPEDADGDGEPDEERETFRGAERLFTRVGR